MHIEKQQRTKFDKKARECIFIEYCVDSKGYRLIDLKNPKRVSKARNVTFIEDEFPEQKDEKKSEKGIIDFGQKNLYDITADKTEEETVLEVDVLMKEFNDSTSTFNEDSNFQFTDDVDDTEEFGKITFQKLQRNEDTQKEYGSQENFRVW